MKSATFWRNAIEKGNADDAALERAKTIMSNYNAIGDAIHRAKTYGMMAHDAVAITRHARKRCAA